jgi:hypothetical protein
VRSLQIRLFRGAAGSSGASLARGATVFGLFGAIVVVVAAIGLFSVRVYLVTAAARMSWWVRIALVPSAVRCFRSSWAEHSARRSSGRRSAVALSVLIGPAIQPLLFAQRRARSDVALVSPWACSRSRSRRVRWPAWRATRVRSVAGTPGPTDVSRRDLCRMCVGHHAWS